MAKRKKQKMSKTATVRARIEPALKKKAESLLGKMGLSATQAIIMFYRQITLNRLLPGLLPGRTKKSQLNPIRYIPIIGILKA